MKPAFQERCGECGRKKPAKRKVSAKAKDTRARKSARKAAKSEVRRMQTGEIRAVVFARAGDTCELCLTERPTEFHHLEGGSGRRREKQAVSNCMAVCWFCHREYHKDPDLDRGTVTAWAKHYGYPMPSRFLREPRAQRAPSGPSPVHAQGVK